MDNSPTTPFTFPSSPFFSRFLSAFVIVLIGFTHLQAAMPAPKDTSTKDPENNFLTLVKSNLEDPSYNPYETDENGWTALHWACWQEHEDAVIKAILEHAKEVGADIVNIGNSYKMTPLMFAVQKNLPSTAKLLIAYGADVNRTSNSGETPLHCAVRGDYKECVHILVRAGADQTVKNNYGQTAADLDTNKELAKVKAPHKSSGNF